MISAFAKVSAYWNISINTFHNRLNSSLTHGIYEIADIFLFVVHMIVLSRRKVLGVIEHGVDKKIDDT